ncbi:MAG TPA: alpha/beta hydrolase [Mycobacteriales bacterium]|nr:alpha/beta hydrolase [Mycobacteriales bacterium]
MPRADRPVVTEEVWHRLPSRPVRSLVLGTARPLAPELVVVPGLGALGYLLPTLHASAGWTRVHLLDLPGFGSPRTADCPAAVDDVTTAVRQWLRQAATGPVLLVGHSTGGQVAAHVTRSEPDLVAALVLSGSVFPPAARTLRGLLPRLLRTLVHESPRELPAVLPEYLRGRRRMLELLASALQDRPEDVVPQVHVPMVVVRGRHDHLCDDAWARQLADAAPRGRVLVVPGAHNTVSTHPAATAAAWRSALS